MSSQAEHSYFMSVSTCSAETGTKQEEKPQILIAGRREGVPQEAEPFSA